MYEITQVAAATRTFELAGTVAKLFILDPRVGETRTNKRGEVIVDMRVVMDSGEFIDLPAPNQQVVNDVRVDIPGGYFDYSVVPTPGQPFAVRSYIVPVSRKDGTVYRAKHYRFAAGTLEDLPTEQEYLASAYSGKPAASDVEDF